MTNLTLPIHLDPHSAPDKTRYVTASGLPVLIYNINGGGDRPIHGAVYMVDEWLPRTWLPNGRYEMSAPEHAFDLRDRHQAKRGWWVAWWEGDEGTPIFERYATKAEAVSDGPIGAILRGIYYLEEGDSLDTPADPPLVVDWSKLPDWAKWAAANKSGDARIFWEQPEPGLTIWRSELRSERLPSHLYRLAPNFDWRDTLIPRPEDV